MKKIKNLSALILCICLIFTASACKKTKGSGDGDKYVKPKNIMTTEEYQAELKDLLKTANFSTADDAFNKKVDDLTDRLKEQIKYNEESVSFTGTAYYVSNDGDDNNDGKSEKTAWKTLEKVNSMNTYNEGDAVLFRRGDTFRGSLSARNGMTYSAYGEGYKPRIVASTNGPDNGTWEKTDTENVWKYSKRFSQQDMGHILFTDKDGNEICGDKKVKPSKLSKNFDFVYCGPTVEEGKIDMCAYVYYDGGNPGEVFADIELPLDTQVITSGKKLHDVTINNLELLHGRGPFWPTDSQNILMSYCIIGWCGGFADTKGGVRYGGGSGAWHGCDNFVYDHCYFYEQFDSGVSPQYDGEEEAPSVFKDFKTTNCLFEGCEYTLEYFNSQKNTLENRFEGMYFAYNLCRKGGYGFGTKTSMSAYVKSWGHENTCIDCQIEYNLFDRAAALTLEVISYEQSASGNTLSYEKMPKINNNIYIQKKDKKFANINNVMYKFNENEINKLIKTGADTDSVYIYSE